MTKNAEMLTPREAALAMGISYQTLKQWIYHKKLKTVRTAGGHHRVPMGEVERYLPRVPAGEPAVARKNFRRISGRNQLLGNVVEVRTEGLLAQIKLSIGGQRITAIITAEAARELGLHKGETVAALIKATEVMILRV
jgi:molybdopterin-binding protein